MTSPDWKRSAAEVLLKLYKEHPILYDMRHPKYYNKTERQKALNTIIDLLEDHRPGTTTNDILRKIQTMRTQFGQELVKLKKAQSRGIEYTPTVWWYSYLAFLKHHIKPRTIHDEEDDPQSEGDYENTVEESYEIEHDGGQIVYEIQSTPVGKGGNLDYEGETRLIRKQNIITPTTISKEEIIYEINNGDGVISKRKTTDLNEGLMTPNVKMARKESPITMETITTNPFMPSTPQLTTVIPGTGGKRNSSSVTPEAYEINVDSDRARSLGQFVMSQISAIKDDYLFYSTQMDVLNVINKAQLKQLQMDKEAEKANASKT
ncbi:uncharacterized protein LOC129757745 [Uranotaenia lowii]|uniref:uncharacterized protein LOC129757745 n=1 Tax=Uranotaenia lowii TaxID=190385 RepID=UPI002479C94C|nr:uncharacterized protein LOC129757745 [Uranotaenia lowii]